MAKLIIGCGYLGLRVARLWRDAGCEVFVVTRSEEKGTKLAAEGLRPIFADIAAGPFSTPSEIETALYAVGFDRSSVSGKALTAGATAGEGPKPAASALPLTDVRVEPAAGDNPRGMPQSIHDVYAGGLEHAIRSLPASLARLIYISTTGVYGQSTGDEVDENSPCQPTREGGLASLAAEQVLLASRFADRSIILRLAGLYGPGRIPRAADLAAGRPIDAPATGWLNLIHVDDAARTVLLAEQKARMPARYVVSDGAPVIRGDYYRELARLLIAPSPKFVEPAADSPAAQRAASDKRVSPRRLFHDLAAVLHYPSYREGLAAIVAGERTGEREV